MTTSSDGRKLDHATLEALRVRAVEQILDGVKPGEIAYALGLTPQAVYGWWKNYRAGGWEALRAKPIPGRPPRISQGQLGQLSELITDHDPRDYGFAEALWTRDIVADLAEETFGVRHSRQWMGHLLRHMGFSPQRPVVRAAEADPVAQQRWVSSDYPAIRAEAARVGATIYFADEAGVAPRHHAGTTWAPVGRTPVVEATSSRSRVNMISAVEQRGTLHFAVFTGSCDGNTFVDFCGKLLGDDGGNVFCIVDNSSIHHSTEVTTWVAEHADAFKLFFLPTYSPHLNPDEWVWKNVKNDRLGRTPPRSPKHYLDRVVDALGALQAAPHIVRGFFNDPHLAYIQK
jgi:transposase